MDEDVGTSRRPRGSSPVAAHEPDRVEAQQEPTTKLHASCLGALGPCGCLFCFPCAYDWVQHEHLRIVDAGRPPEPPSCPNCRAPATSIVRRSVNGVIEKAELPLVRSPSREELLQ
eukprot:2108938-Prymnesium_polylepis.2